MKLEIAKQIFDSLKEEDKLHLIEEVMPCSGTYRQLENKGFWSDGQWLMLADNILKSYEWEKGT